MIRIVALVCAVLGPCDRDTARNVVMLGEVDSPQTCLWQAQFRAGSVAALQVIAPGERIVFSCEPVRAEE